MASANVSKLFHQFGLAATLLLQLHGLLYVYITYRHHVNKILSIYYAVKRTIAQKFNPCCRANSAKSNYMRISIPLKGHVTRGNLFLQLATQEKIASCDIALTKLSRYAATGIPEKRACPVAM